MTRLILGHLMDRVVDGVIAKLLGFRGDGELALTSAGLCLGALLEVGLGVPYLLAASLATVSQLISTCKLLDQHL